MAGLVVGGKGSGDGRERNSSGGRIRASGGVGNDTLAGLYGTDWAFAVKLDSKTSEDILALFNALNDEMLARIQEDDDEVPWRRHGWWHWSRTGKGCQYETWLRRRDEAGAFPGRHRPARLHPCRQPARRHRRSGGR